MGNGFVWLRSKTTGKTGLYPEFFLTWPDFEELEPISEPCVDCVVHIEEDEPDDDDFEEVDD